MARQPYGAAWDLGADHGLLADAIERDGLCGRVHAVDRVPELCDRMATRYPALDVACLDLHRVVFNPVLGRTLVVVAGLGGDTVADAVERVLARHSGWPLDFLLCPVRQCWALRERLAALPLEVQEEALVCERGRIYEVMRLRVAASPRRHRQPWPAGVIRWPEGALRARYLAERVHAHRHSPNTAAAYAACLQHKDEEARRCVG